MEKIGLMCAFLYYIKLYVRCCCFMTQKWQKLKEALPVEKGSTSFAFFDKNVYNANGGLYDILHFVCAAGFNVVQQHTLALFYWPQGVVAAVFTV